MANDQELLTLDLLASGDRPAMTMVGLIAARVLKEHEVVVFMVDVLGRVQVMPANSVSIRQRARVEDEDLDALREAEAIQVMLNQGDSEEVMIEYLRKREERGIDAHAGLRQDAVLSDDTATSDSSVREES